MLSLPGFTALVYFVKILAVFSTKFYPTFVRYNTPGHQVSILQSKHVFHSLREDYHSICKLTDNLFHISKSFITYKKQHITKMWRPFWIKTRFQFPITTAANSSSSSLQQFLHGGGNGIKSNRIF